MFDLAIKEAQVVFEDGVMPATVAVKDGVIALVARPEAEIEAGEVLNFPGCYLLPGAIDAHSHVTYCDDFLHGTRTAASGGVTTIVEMPLSLHLPAVTTPKVLRDRIVLAQKEAAVDFALWGGAQPDSLACTKALHHEGAAAFKIFMNYVGEEYRHFDDYSLLNLMETVREFDGLIGVHAESEALCSGFSSASQAAGRGAEAHNQSRPVIAEAEAVSRLCLFALKTGCRTHVCHVTSPKVAGIILEAREKGARITYETCPHYLVLTQKDVEQFGAYAKCNPPMREAEDVEGLWDLILSGQLDSFGSDHTAYSGQQKETGSFWTAPGGFPGMDLLLPTLISEGVHKRGLSWEMAARITASNPARIFGLSHRKGAVRIGLDADFAVIDPHKEWVFRAENAFYGHKSANYPYEGRHYKGAVRAALVRGKVVYENGNCMLPPGFGRFVPAGR